MFRPAWAGQVCSLGYQIGPALEEALGIRLTGEQRGRVIDYWRLDPVSGVRLVRRAALRRPKGAGKSPEGAYVGFAEFCLPVVFDRWDESGQPVGVCRRDPWIQFAAVSEDQTDNVMVWLYEQLADNPATCARHNIDLGRTRVYFKDRPGRMEPVSASAGSREGQRLSFAVLDQTESWFKENGGQRLAATMRRNVGKFEGWSLELQNAPGIGDGSVADETAKASGLRAKGVLYDTREPAGVASLDLSDGVAVREALAYAYGDSAAPEGWVNLDRLVDEIQDPATDPADARRYYLNVAVPSSEWAFDRERWKQLGTGEVPAAGELIVAGFDGSRHDDATALVAIGVESGCAWLAGVWERPEHVEDWEVPEAEVTAAVLELFDRWPVWRIYCDPAYWQPTIASWEAARLKGSDRRPAVLEWWTNRWRAVGYACRNLATSIRAGEVTHVVDPGDDVLSRHVGNAVRRTVASRDDQGRPLWTLSKPAPGRKIDAAMALVLAWEARNDAIAAGATARTRKAVFV